MQAREFVVFRAIDWIEKIILYFRKPFSISSRDIFFPRSESKKNRLLDDANHVELTRFNSDSIGDALIRLGR